MDTSTFIVLIILIVFSAFLYGLYSLKAKNFSSLRLDFIALRREYEKLAAENKELKIINNILRTKEELEHGCN